MYLFLKTIYKCLFLFLRIVLSFIVILLYPFFYILRFKKNKIRYFSVIGYNYLYARPQAFCKYLSKYGYNVTYSFVKDKNILNYNEISNNNEYNIKVKDYIYDDNNKFFNRLLLLIKSLFMNYDIVIITNPTQIVYIDIWLIKLKGTKIVYDCMDYYKYWIDKKNYNYFHKYEKELLKYANVITTSSNSLKKYLCTTYHLKKDVYVIKNGYEINKHKYKNIKLKHPNAVFIGSVGDYFDFDVVKKYAIKHKKFMFYIIGPITKSAKNRVKSLPNNVIMYGAVNHNEIPAFIKDADVLIMTCIVNDLTKHVNPIKLYEYLYYKKPVVSAYWEELEEFRGLVKFYVDYDSFDESLNNSFQIDNKKIDLLLKRSTWNVRTKEFVKYIK